MNRKYEAYGSSKLKLRPLHPFVGLEATRATSIAITPKHTTLHNKHKYTIVRGSFIELLYMSIILEVGNHLYSESGRNFINKISKNVQNIPVS